MHGLIFMTWEKYLAERFGRPFLSTYRDAIGETQANLPLANRLYDDATLVAEVSAASELIHLSVDALLREYGRYFILNGLTGHLCTYLLTQVHSSRDLLLTMRDAHARLRRTLDGGAPPLFTYEASSRPHEVVLIYDSLRHLCSVLRGAIEGAAERYGERVRVIEQTCMKRGATVCRFQARFFAPSPAPQEHLKTPEQVARQKAQKELTDQVLSLLPDNYFRFRKNSSIAAAMAWGAKCSLFPDYVRQTEEFVERVILRQPNLSYENEVGHQWKRVM